MGLSESWRQRQWAEEIITAESEIRQGKQPDWFSELVPEEILLETAKSQKLKISDRFVVEAQSIALALSRLRYFVGIPKPSEVSIEIQQAERKFREFYEFLNKLDPGTREQFWSPSDPISDDIHDRLPEHGGTGRYICPGTKSPFDTLKETSKILRDRAKIIKIKNGKGGDQKDPPRYAAQYLYWLINRAKKTRRCNQNEFQAFAKVVLKPALEYTNADGKRIDIPRLARLTLESMSQA